MYPDEDNGDVLRRLEKNNFDFSIKHPVDFYAIYATEEEADIVAKLYVNDWNKGQKFKNIETRPNEEGGMELQLVPIMKVTHENISAFEAEFAKRTSKVTGYLDGWGIWNG